MKNLNKIVNWLLSKTLWGLVFYIVIQTINIGWEYLPYELKYGRVLSEVVGIILINVSVWLTNKITPWLVNLYKKAMELGMNFGLKIRAKFVK